MRRKKSRSRQPCRRDAGRCPMDRPPVSRAACSRCLPWQKSDFGIWKQRRFLIKARKRGEGGGFTTYLVAKTIGVEAGGSPRLLPCFYSLAQKERWCEGRWAGGRMVSSRLAELSWSARHTPPTTVRASLGGGARAWSEPICSRSLVPTARAETPPSIPLCSELWSLSSNQWVLMESAVYPIFVQCQRRP